MLAYENTAANARDIGWGFLPEYCEGDRAAQYVVHDTARGMFVFTNDIGNAKLVG